MHPIEAASILSQLAYIPPVTVTSLADAYAIKYGYNDIPFFAPVTPYTPLFSEFAYAAHFRLIPNTPNKDVYQYEFNNKYYNPSLVGRESSYERTLFLMRRDETILEAIAKSKPSKTYYCIRNEDPIETNLTKAAFKEIYNVATVYPCTGPLHDAHVPKCACPAPSPPAKLTALTSAIAAVQKAAPFKNRLRDLHAAVADAHKAAISAEQATGLTSLQIGFADNDVITLGDDFEWVENTQRSSELVARAAKARADADAAETTLATYIAEQENMAFAVFKPEVRSILTRLRANDIDGYVQPYFSLSINDILDGDPVDDDGSPWPYGDPVDDDGSPWPYKPDPLTHNSPLDDDDHKPRPDEPSEQWPTSDDDEVRPEDKMSI